MNTPEFNARQSLLELIVGESHDAAQIGKRTLLLARLHRCQSVRRKSQRELAALLGISEAAVSKRVKLLRKICNTCEPKHDPNQF